MDLTSKSVNKGLMKTLEAVIAILMVLTTVFIYFNSKESFPEFYTINRQLRGFQSLKVLDENNNLRSDVLANNTVNIENNLKPLLPPEVNYQVFVCQTTCGKSTVKSEKMVSVEYIIAGDLDNFSPRQVVLYMW